MAEASRRIVIVDDEEALVWSLASRLAKARPHDVVETAHDGETALAMLRERPADLLIADVRMPGMSGIELIVSVRKDRVGMPAIVMTAFPTSEMSRVAPGPFTGFLEKPFEFDRLLELTTIALQGERVGFSGAISVQTLPDIVQLYVLSSSTGALVIGHHTGDGEVWFDRGEILHAVTPRAIGDEAFYEIMEWSGGVFTMRVGARTMDRSVRGTWQELLMESCRRADERGRDDADEPARDETSKPGWTLVPPPSDAIDALWEDPFTDPEMWGLRRSSPPSSRNNATSMEAELNIKDSLAKLNEIDGFIGAAVVDSESGMMLGHEGGGGLNLEVAAAGNSEVVKSKRKVMASLNLKDSIEDMLISLGKAYHIIRPLRSRPGIFFYIVLDRGRANLAMARIALSDVEKDLQL